MKIYTRRGDAGETDLFGGDRVRKEHARVEAYGQVDELNAFVGAAIAASEQKDLLDFARRIQSTLFDLGSFLATPDAAQREKASIPEVTDADVEALEAEIDRLEGELEPLRSFILPEEAPPPPPSTSLAPSAGERSARRFVSTPKRPWAASPSAT